MTPLRPGGSNARFNFKFSHGKQAFCMWQIIVFSKFLLVCRLATCRVASHGLAQPEWNPGLRAAEHRMHGIEHKSAMITAATVMVTAKVTVLQIPGR